ncbi:MAG TPA: glycosyltransferase family 2 protein [Candidatus Acidoferrales bacterium]|jgi:dolichol-phosphate mannosyltransferase|nr:glycosyltransferase family 2 protein [Candidatus Acidoferrales bacterium]
MPEPVTLSVVAPCHNEADNLIPFVTAIQAALDPLNISYEIVLTDDRSTDNSWEILQNLGAKDPRIRAVRFAKNAGQSAAIWAAIKAAQGRYVATLDADLQNDPADLPQFLEAIKNFDCVCGNRKANRAKGDSIIRQLSSKIANGIRNWMTQETVTDSACGYRMFRRECADNLKFFKGMHRFMPTLFKIEGYTITEIPVRHHARAAGVSHYGVWNRAFAALYDLFAVRWMQKRMFRFSVAERINLPPDGK